MVCEWGMSNTMGPLTFGKKEEQIFLGREIAQHQDYSEDTALRIDQEVKRFVTDNYGRAQTLIVEHKQKILDMADALLARETLDAEQVKRICAGLPLDELITATASGSTPTAPREAKPAKERPAAGIVPAIPPRPVTQE
jgi:cell division protease FtsH